MKNKIICLTFWFLAFPCLALDNADFSYISNKKIKIGVIKNYGAIIGFFSKMPDGKNFINTYDAGREIQQSFYGGYDGSRWWNKNWRWNPVQGGSHENDKSKLLEFKNTGEKIYAKINPRNWAGKQLLKDVVMEETITLDNEIAHVKFKCIYSGTNNHPEIHQELPAVFIDAEYDTLIYYDGKMPWSGDKLTQKIPGFPNEEIQSYENWNAYVKNDYGIGVYTPGSDKVTCYRFIRTNTNKPADLSCSYFAPVRTMAVTTNFAFEYDVYLTIGNTKEIRERFYKIHKQRL